MGDEGLLDEAMIRLRIPPLLPTSGRGEQDDTLFSPSPDPQRFEVGIVTDDRFRLQGEEERGFLGQRMTLIDIGGLGLDQFGKASLVRGQVQAVAIDPTVVSTVPPSRIGVQIAQFLRDAACLAVRLVPHGPLGLEETGIFN